MTNEEIVIRDLIKKGHTSLIQELLCLRIPMCGRLPIKMVRFPFNEKGITVSKDKIPSFSFIKETSLEILEPASYVLPVPTSNVPEDDDDAPEDDNDGEDVQDEEYEDGKGFDLAEQIFRDLLWDRSISRTTRIEIGNEINPKFLQEFTGNDPSQKGIYQMVSTDICPFTFWGWEDLAPQISVVDVAEKKPEGEFKMSGIVSITYF